VIFDDKTPDKPQIDYPTQWGFKLIGRDQEALRQAIRDVMGDREHLCHLGHSSRTGKFHTWNATCTVEHEADRDALFKAFADHDAVEMVI